MIKARYLCYHLISSTSFVVYLSSTELRRLADGGHSNHRQNAADFQIHLCHLLATSKEITSKFSLGESTPIYPDKYFYLSIFILILF